MLVSKRCRPLLGTYVEVTLQGGSAAALAAWTEAAFAAVAEVGRTMSFHDPASELAKLNRAAVGEWVEVGAEMGAVLALAKEIEEETEGAFNVAVGRPLARWGILPGGGGDGEVRRRSFEVEGRRARRLTAAWVDLGGIAKGFAVDRAVEQLSTHGLFAGVVNAGGDLRVFGPVAHDVLIRPSGRLVKLADAAIATSSTQPHRQGRGPLVSAYVDVARQEPLTADRTVSVRAPRCVLADALTKVALFCDATVRRRLSAKYGATMEDIA